MKKKLLIADDDVNIIASLKFLLADEGHEISGATSVDSVLEVMASQSIDLVLMDMNFHQDTTSGKEGIELIQSIQSLDAEVPIIVMTGWATVEVAVEALKQGAKDFIQKPWNDEVLLAAIETQLRAAGAEKKAARLSQQNRILNSQIHSDTSDGIVAHSAVMRALIDSINDLAKSDMNILLTGDNGTGKSMLAHHLHRVSGRAKQSFVAVNMGAVSENLFESEMFGHVKGAYTDAKESRIGRVEMAEGGTLFLDELANIPLSQQAKLLRVLEEQQFERVGSSKTQHSDVRVVSATNADLGEMISLGQFRQDLYYRLNTIELRVPSLKERPEDIQALAEYFLAIHSRKYSKPCPVLSAEAVAILQNYDWPGNIRELKHMTERLLFTSKTASIEAQDLGSLTGETDSGEHRFDLPNLSLDEIEKRVLLARLKFCQGNVSETAKSLGLSRSGYYRRVYKHGLDS